MNISFACARCGHLATVHTSKGCVMPGCACAGFTAQDFKPGDQVVYIPRDGDKIGDLNRAEYGFIIGVGALPDHHWCRFWYKGQEGILLRTVRNSEQTPDHCLMLMNSCNQEMVDIELAKILDEDVVTWEEV